MGAVSLNRRAMIDYARPANPHTEVTGNPVFRAQGLI